MDMKQKNRRLGIRLKIILPITILIALICLSVGIGFLISYFVGRNFLAKEIAIEEKQLLETEAKQLVEEQQKQ